MTHRTLKFELNKVTFPDRLQFLVIIDRKYFSSDQNDILCTKLYTEARLMLVHKSDATFM